MPGRLNLNQNDFQLLHNLIDRFQTILLKVRAFAGVATSTHSIGNARICCNTNLKIFQLVCVVVVGGLLQSCQLFTNGKNLNNNANAVAISRPDQSGPRAAIGATEHPKILANYGGSYVNAPLEALVTSIVGKLVTHSDEPSQNYRVTILNSPAVNAFALPGGYLYVTRGLLALANDEAELAAVMAHEMSHITSDHGIARSRKAGASVIAGRVVSDVLTNEVAGKIARASSRQKLALFSRNQELQADARGINTLGKAGYDPYAAARFLKSMTRYAAYRSGLRSESGDDDFLNSHPSTPRRVELARRHARAFGTPGVGKRNRSNYLSSINGIMFGDSAEQGFVRGRQFSHKALGITFTVPTGFAIDNKAEAVLASGPNETAIRFDAVSNSSGGNLTDYLNSGWVNGLKKATISSGSINGLPSATGQAATGKWVFDITVIRYGNKIYRFIVAAQASASSISPMARMVTQSFRRLSRAEKAALRPLQIRVVVAGPSDSFATLARRMAGATNKLKLFRALNALPPGTRLNSGQMVKLIVKN